MNKHSSVVVLELIARSQFLLVFGTVLLFSSWIFQSVFEANHRDKVADMHRLQVAIDIAQIRLDMWSLELQTERGKTKPSDTKLLLSSLKFFQALVNIDAWEQNRLTEDKAKIEAIYTAKTVGNNLAMKYFKAGDLKNLTDLLDGVVKIENGNGYRVKKNTDYITLRNQLSQKANNARISFIVFYCIGSLLLGIHWYIRRSVNSK